MKSFGDFIKDVKGDIFIWGRSGMAGSVKALYSQKTMLKNSDIVVVLEDENHNIIESSSKPTVNCQYNTVWPTSIAAHIVDGKLDIVAIFYENSKMAHLSMIRTIDGHELAHGCKFNVIDGKLKLQFQQLVKLPNINQRCYITVIVGPKTLQWAKKFDNTVLDIDEGSSIKAFAKKHDIEPPNDPVEWKKLYRNNDGILKDL